MVSELGHRHVDQQAGSGGVQLLADVFADALKLAAAGSIEY